MECQDENIRRIDFHKLDCKRKFISRSMMLSRVSKQMKARPPKIQEFLDADQLMYIKSALDEVVLNYNNLSYNFLYENTVWHENKSLDESLEKTENLLEAGELFKSESNFITYEYAIKISIKNPKRAKEILIDLVNDAVDLVEPACYAIAVMIFKETINKCDVLNNFEGNIEAIENCKYYIEVVVRLLNFSEIMEPACYFLLGMLKKYNIGNMNRFIYDKHEWQKDFIEVIKVARNCGIFNIPQYVCHMFELKNTRNCGLGLKNKKEYLTEISKYAMYEIALGMSPELYSLNEQIDLLNI